MKIDFAKFDRLEMQVAAKRGQYDAARDALGPLKNQNRAAVNEYFPRLQSLCPTLPPSPLHWLDHLDEDQLAASGIKRQWLEELSVNTARVDRLTATIETTGRELQPLQAVAIKCRDFIDAQNGVFKL